MASLPSRGNRGVWGQWDNYPIDFNISKNHILLRLLGYAFPRETPVLLHKLPIIQTG